MFSGIIEGVGKIAFIKEEIDGIALTIEVPNSFCLQEVKLGDSIAVNGACMTVIGILDGAFRVHVSGASLQSTTGLNTLGYVNLEKSVQVSDRLHGHLVSGHVDGVGHVEYFEKIGDSWRLRIRPPINLCKFIAQKGSITVHGVSLTINEIDDSVFEVNVIPYTLEHTVFKFFKKGFAVNIEVDIIARYVEKMLLAYIPCAS